MHPLLSFVVTHFRKKEEKNINNKKTKSAHKEKTLIFRRPCFIFKFHICRDMSKTPGLPPIGKSQSARESAEKEEIDNPFKLPSDDKIFRMREEEKLRKEAERENRSHMKIWQKSKTEVMSRSGRLQDLVGESRIATLNDVAAKTDADGKIIVHRRQEKENMTEFIAKKREMFLVQMSLDTKREEIRKLEEKAQMKEEALQRSEQMLEEDAMRFDAFLKENDKKAHDAIKRAGATFFPFSEVYFSSPPFLCRGRNEAKTRKNARNQETHSTNTSIKQ